jgi:hypothetical protein
MGQGGVGGIRRGPSRLRKQSDGRQMEVKVEAMRIHMGLEESRTWAGQVAVAQGTGKTVAGVNELQCQGIGRLAVCTTDL